MRYLLNTHWHNDHNMGNGIYMAAFPALAIIAHVDTQKDMYRTGTTPSRFEQQIATRERRLESRHDDDGAPLDDVQIAAIKKSLTGKKQVLEELHTFVYQPPTVTFDGELHVDIGHREVQVKHMGRGTTRGDTIVYLPKERILIAGDLLTHPVLYTYDGFPTEWIQTLERMARLDAGTIVPGHGDVLHDLTFLNLARDLLKSAVEQVSARLSQLTSTLENPSFEDVRKGVDLTPFRQAFATGDADAAKAFDEAAAALVKVAYNEAIHNR